MSARRVQELAGLTRRRGERLADPLSHPLEVGEDARIGDRERIVEVPDLVVLAPSLVDLHECESVPRNGVLSGHHLVVSHEEVVCTIDPGFDLEAYEQLRRARETLIRAQRDFLEAKAAERTRPPLGSA